MPLNILLEALMALDY